MEKDIWVGLDVHARTIVMARLQGDEQEATVESLPNDPKLIERRFRKLSQQGQLWCCYEAGPCGFELYRQLQRMGIECIVVAPSLIPRRPGDRVKTDRRDAVRLARLLRAGELQAIYVPDEQSEAVRDLLRAREQLKRDLTAARHRLSKFLLRHGRHYSEGRNWTQRHWEWVRAQRFEREAERFVFQQYCEQLQDLQERLGRFDEQIAQLAQQPPYRERVERLCCLRGVSTLTAMVLLTELGDIRRFRSAPQMMSYLGLIPSEHSSGGRRRQGPITRMGNAHLRRVVVGAAWSYRNGLGLNGQQRKMLAEQPPEVRRLVRRATYRLQRRFGRLRSQGKCSQKTVVAVARELCGFIWALERLALSN